MQDIIFASHTSFWWPHRCQLLSQFTNCKCDITTQYQCSVIIELFVAATDDTEFYFVTECVCNVYVCKICEE